MAKATDKVEATEEPKVTLITPKALGEELDVNPKRIRAYLRQEHGRNADAKNTSWMLDEATAQLVRDRFTPADEADEATDSES